MMSSTGACGASAAQQISPSKVPVCGVVSPCGWVERGGGDGVGGERQTQVAGPQIDRQRHTSPIRHTEFVQTRDHPGHRRYPKAETQWRAGEGAGGCVTKGNTCQRIPPKKMISPEPALAPGSRCSLWTAVVKILTLSTPTTSLPAMSFLDVPNFALNGRVCVHVFWFVWPDLAYPPIPLLAIGQWAPPPPKGPDAGDGQWSINREAISLRAVCLCLCTAPLHSIDGLCGTCSSSYLDFSVKSCTFHLLSGVIWRRGFGVAEPHVHNGHPEDQAPPRGVCRWCHALWSVRSRGTPQVRRGIQRPSQRPILAWNVTELFRNVVHLPRTLGLSGRW